MMIGSQSRLQRDFFRSYVKQVICRFLDCGILHNGFTGVKCPECGHEYLLAFSCKRRHFFVHHVIRNGWWNSASVFAKKSSGPYPTAISS
ncbi:MAG: transposase zinc-binding domain-containing protein [Deltaproteobacteria bacterium]|nr:transposase zinc-binding domain-containing protein [Deltaproteobacteria bacterium]